MNMRRLPMLFAMLAAGLLAGCGGGGTSRIIPPGDDPVDVAWDAFETGDYADARDQFLAILAENPTDAEAMNGVGWCYARLDALPDAETWFTACIAAAPSNPEPRAGLAAVGLAREDWAAAIANADAALGLAPQFEFSYDSSITWEDLRLIIAQASFVLNDYPRAIAEIDSLGGAQLDPGSENLASEILAELEALGANFRLASLD